MKRLIRPSVLSSGVRMCCAAMELHRQCGCEDGEGAIFERGGDRLVKGSGVRMAAF